jgi:hypothetical protein
MLNNRDSGTRSGHNAVTEAIVNQAYERECCDYRFSVKIHSDTYHLYSNLGVCGELRERSIREAEGSTVVKQRRIEGGEPGSIEWGP